MGPGLCLVSLTFVPLACKACRAPPVGPVHQDLCPPAGDFVIPMTPPARMFIGIVLNARRRTMAWFRVRFTEEQ
jgi:hypothetical protein